MRSLAGKDAKRHCATYHEGQTALAQIEVMLLNEYNGERRDEAVQYA